MDAIYNGISTIIGIIIGVLVTIGADYIKSKIQYRKDLNTFKHELKTNIHKIDCWMELVRSIRDKVNSDRILEFGDYFNFSTASFLASGKLWNQGLLYSKLDYDDIDGIQRCWSFLSMNNENVVNNNIANYKQTFSFNRQYYNKTIILRDIDNWESRLKDSKKTMEKILVKI